MGVALCSGMATKRPLETDLYQPVKALLEEQGYEVKGEVGAADVVGYRDGSDPVIVELKTGFSLSLFHQAVERLAITEMVYIAVPRGKGAAAWKAIKSNTKLCRRLGLGLMTVRLKDGLVEIYADPAPYHPRKSKQKKASLLSEFERRVGDPNKGGSTTRTGRMTAYRQDALRCLSKLNADGPSKASDVAKATNVMNARQIMYDDHYGWFTRVDKGIYGLTDKGSEAVGDYADALKTLK